MYLGQLIDGAHDVEQTGLSSSRVAEDDYELPLPDVDGHTSEGCHPLKAKEVSFMDIFA